MSRDDHFFWLESLKVLVHAQHELLIVIGQQSASVARIHTEFRLGFEAVCTRPDETLETASAAVRER